MSDPPENLTLVFLRRLDAKTDGLAMDLCDLKHRMTAVETQVSQVASTMASPHASTTLRIEERLERQADMLPAWRVSWPRAMGFPGQSWPNAWS